MPAGLVHQHHAMRTGGHRLGEFGEKQVHRCGVEPGQHQRHPGVARRADGTDDPGRLVTDIAPPARGMAALPPDIAGAPLLPDPGLVPGLRRGRLWLQISNRCASGCAAAISFRQAANPPF